MPRPYESMSITYWPIYSPLDRDTARTHITSALYYVYRRSTFLFRRLQAMQQVSISSLLIGVTVRSESAPMEE